MASLAPLARAARRSDSVTFFERGTGMRGIVVAPVCEMPSAARRSSLLKPLHERRVLGRCDALLQDFLHAAAVTAEECLGVEPQPRQARAAQDSVGIGRVRDKTLRDSREPQRVRSLCQQHEVLADAVTLVVELLLVRVDGNAGVRHLGYELGRAGQVTIVILIRLA